MYKKGKISIIIPVYNAENYLERCLNSILKQTYKTLQIILVNDGSTDSSAKICEKYAEIDHRISVIHKKNSGPSVARKEGIKVASGEYIGFVDADDYIDLNMFEILIKGAYKGADIIECGYREVTTEGELIKEYNLVDSLIEGSYNCALNYAVQKNTTNFLWNKLYKTQLLKNINFPELYAGEDSCILTQVYNYTERIVKIKESFYNYVMTPNSLCREPFSEKKLDNIEAGIFMYEFYVRNEVNLRSFSALYICSYAAKLYCEIIDKNVPIQQEKIDYLLDNFIAFYDLSKDKLARTKSSKKRVFFIEMFNRSPRMSLLIYRIFNRS